MRVVTWNLFHGRADPAAGRPLLHEFAETIASWPWDVALLQEVPPWWPAPLARRCGATWRSSLTSRNQGLALRRAVSSRRPDLLRSNGGGSNAILVRAPFAITAHGSLRLRVLPERRGMHAVRLADTDTAGGPFDGVWVGNVHGQLGRWDGGPGLADPLADLRRSIERLAAWEEQHAAADVPLPIPVTDRLVLGGDLNLPRDAVEAALPDGWTRCASSPPDHVLGRGIAAVGDSRRPDRGTLSDHAPLLVELGPA